MRGRGGKRSQRRGADTTSAAAGGSLEVRIESLAAGGDGVAHGPDGRVLFVPFTAPGDRVRVTVTEARARFARGRVEALLEAGPARVDPVCPAFGSCGGCAWQHVDYGVQLEAKRRIVEDALTRIGGIHFDGAIESVASPDFYGYRSRTRVVRSGARIGYRRRRSRAVHAVSRCPVLTEGLDAALHDLAAAPGESSAGGEEEWELAQGAGAPRVVRLGAPLPGPAPAPLELEVLGDRLRISPGVFFQANALLRDALVTAVIDAAGRGDAAVEAFAGAGFFTLALSRRFTRVTAIEADPSAARDLRGNLAAAERANVEVLAEDLVAAVGRLAPAEALILDPPRSGLSPGSVGDLATLAPERIVYLSCDPATLARDLSAFQAEGYRVSALTVFDLFPQTPHVETLARLERRSGAGS